MVVYSVVFSGECSERVFQQETFNFVINSRVLLEPHEIATEACEALRQLHPDLFFTEMSVAGGTLH